MDMKTCSECNKESPLEEYSFTNRKHIKRVSHCKKCGVKRANKWRKDNPEKVRESLKKYYDKNQERQRERGRNNYWCDIDKKKQYNKGYYAQRQQLHYEGVRLFVPQCSLKTFGAKNKR